MQGALDRQIGAGSSLRVAFQFCALLASTVASALPGWRCIRPLACALLVWVSQTAAPCDGASAGVPNPSQPLVAPRTARDRAGIDCESRSVLTGTRHRFELSIPPQAELEIAAGVPGVGPSWKSWPRGLERIEFSVAFEQDGNRRPLLEYQIERPPDGENSWHDFTVDLSAVGGQRGTLTLDAAGYTPPTPECGIAGSDPRQIVWTNPRFRRSTVSDGTNLILVSIDTLRADHLGCYGYGPPTSPTIDRMAREGIRFRDFTASSSWTLPSHASMLTGLEPARHAAVKFSFVPLSTTFDTLAEVLGDVGYESAAFVGGGFVGSHFALDQGFDRFWENPATKSHGDSLQSVVDMAKPWMERRRGTRFFLFLHTYQVHIPYNPPPPYDTVFDPHYRGAYQTQFLTGDARALVKRGIFDAQTLHHLSALYDGEIRAMDDAMGNLLDFLQSTGLARNTCVLFTSDHGEEFGEHGDLMHSKAKLFEELIRVPLIVWCPAKFRAGPIVSGPASHIDILPTAVEIGGGTAPTDIDGRSLVPVLRGGAVTTREAAVSEVDGSVERKQGTVRAVRTERYKLIESSIDGSEILFDVLADPAESHDLRAERGDLAGTLRGSLDRRAGEKSVAGVSAGSLDEATRERLRALGYIE